MPEKKETLPTPLTQMAFYKFFNQMKVREFFVVVFWGFLIENLQYLLFSG